MSDVDEFTGVSGGGLTPVKPHYRSPSPYRTPRRDDPDGDVGGRGFDRSGSPDGDDSKVSSQEGQSGMSISAINLSNVLSSSRTSGLATALVGELSTLVETSGEQSVNGLLPILVGMLQTLDESLRDLNQTQSCLEEISEDNEQLHAQYEREKKLRRDEQRRHLAAEDTIEGERRDTNDQLDSLKQNNRRLQKQLNSSKDQMRRSEEKTEQLKSEFSELKNKYTRVNHALQLAVGRDKRGRRASQITMASPVPSGDIDPNSEEFVLHSLPAVSASRLTMPFISSSSVHETSEGSPTYSTAIGFKRVLRTTSERNEDAVTQEVAAASRVPARVVAARQGVFHPMAASSPVRPAQPGGAVDMPADAVTSRLTSATADEIGTMAEEESIRKKHATVSDEPSAANDELPVARTVSLPSVEQETGDARHVSFPAAEPAMEDDDMIAPSSVAHKHSVSGYDSLTASAELGSPQAQDVDDELEYEQLLQAHSRRLIADASADNEDSLVQELSGQFVTEDGSLLDVDPGLDITLMDNDHLVKQIHDLDKKRNELEAIIDERDKRIQEFIEEQEFTGQEKETAEKQRTVLNERIATLEETVREKETTLEGLEVQRDRSDEPLFPGADEEWRVNREGGRRFTRVEMARMVKERNEFKEKYYSLKEEVEMLREELKKSTQPTPVKKEKHGIWERFLLMFSSKKSTASPGKEPMDESSLAMLPSGVTRSSAKGMQEETNPVQIQQAISFDESRFDAYGWNLPAVMRPATSPPPDADADGAFTEVMTGELNTVPVLTHSSPMANAEQLDTYTNTPSKVFCSAAVCCTPQSDPSQPPSDTVCPSSLVWLSVGTNELSRVDVVDTNSPREVIRSFPVGTSPILAMACVPGVELYGEGDNVHIANSGTDSRTLTRAEIDKWRLNMSPAHSPEHQPQQHLAVKGLVEADAMSLHSGHFASGSSSEADPRSPVRSRVTSPDEDPVTPMVEVAEHAFGADQTDRGIVVEPPADRASISSSKPQLRHVPSEILNRPKLLAPTMWLGAEFGALYVHSAVSNWQACLFAMKVEASVLSITYTRNKVFVAMENGHIMVFHRGQDRAWDFDNYDIIEVSKNVENAWGGRSIPATAVLVVNNTVWCGVGNAVVAIDVNTHDVVNTVVVHPSNRSIVQRLVRCGDGVWISVRRDSTLRLFNAVTMEHLQDMDVSSPMQALLGLPGSRRKPSPHNLVRISSMAISNGCLWIGANIGSIITIPCSNVRPKLIGEDAPTVVVQNTDDGSVALVAVPSGIDPLTADMDEMDGERESNGQQVAAEVDGNAVDYNIPYCDLRLARLSYHGHLHHVDVLVASPGVMATKMDENGDVAEVSSSMTYVLSAGSGYVDFRTNDGTTVTKAQAERNNLIVWQVTNPSS